MQVHQRIDEGVSDVPNLPFAIADAHRFHTIYDSYDIISGIYLSLGCLFFCLSVLVLMKMLCFASCKNWWRGARTLIGNHDRRKRE